MSPKAARVPPHDHDAEEALLGAMMLSAEARRMALGIVRAEAFYKPAHAHVFDAIAELDDDDAPVDAVTVADVLRRQGLLEVVGDKAGLLQLVAATPASSSAPRYAQVVMDRARERRLIAVATQIAEAGYAGADVERALEQLDELRVSSIAERRLEPFDWRPLFAGELPRIEPTILKRTDGHGLFYEGRMHMLHAEHTSGKSWVALLAAVERLELGEGVLYLDYEDEPYGMADRLLSMGADPDKVAAGFVYVRPEGPIGPQERLELAELVEERAVGLVVIDGVGEALVKQGCDEDRAAELLTWFEALPRFLTRLGAAVVMLDHVVKDKERQGRWARGTGAKMAAIDGASFTIRVTTPFSRNKAGRVSLILTKDRPGAIGANGDVVATLAVAPEDDGARVVLTLDPPEHASIESGPSDCMVAVSNYLEGVQSPQSKRALEKAISGFRAGTIRWAIDELVKRGFVQRFPQGNATLHRLRAPYDPEVESVEPDTDEGEAIGWDL